MAVCKAQHSAYHLVGAQLCMWSLADQTDYLELYYKQWTQICFGSSVFFYLVPLCPRIHLFLIWDREKVAGWHKAGYGQEGEADGHTVLV